MNKSFSGVRVLHDVGFEAYPGQVLGLVGENGSGKSTTMNILAGVLERDSGTVLLDSASYSPRNRREADAAGVAFIQQELNIFPNLTVAENMFLNRLPRLLDAVPILSSKKMRARARELLREVDLDVDPGALAGTLSAGERQLLEIARGLSSDARVMILDEPTTSLTQREIERLFEIISRLRTRGVAIIFISHALQDVLQLSDRIVVMRDGQVTLRTENAGMSAHDLVEAMVGRSIEALFPSRAPKTGATPTVLEVVDLAASGTLEGISLQVREGEIVGIAGLMGSGRTELARTLFGLDPHDSGIVRVAGRTLASADLPARFAAGVAFLTEDRRHEGLLMEANVAENMALAALPMFAKGIGRRIHDKGLATSVQDLAQRLRLKSGNIFKTPVRTLSGGNQQKVLLGRWLLRGPKLFLLDEPTRGVDVGAKEEIYRVLAELADSGMGILLISSELEELIGLSDRIVVMRRGRLSGQFERAEFDQQQILQKAFGQENAA